MLCSKRRRFPHFQKFKGEKMTNFTRISVLVLVLCFTFMACGDNGIFSPAKEADCVIVGSLTVQEDFEGDIKFLGEIKNQGNGKALFVNITFTMKNAAGNVIDTDFTYVTSTDLDPGQTSSFEVWTSTPFKDVDSYDYEIDWTDEE